MGAAVGVVVGAIGLMAASGGPAAGQAQDAHQLAPWLELPSGWTRAVEGSVVVAMPGDQPAGASFLLMVEPPQTAGGAPTGTLAEAYRAALADLGPWTPVGDPVEAELDGGWRFRQGVGVARLGNAVYTALTAVARHGELQVRFWALADTDATFNRYKEALGNAIGSVQDLTLSPATPAPAPAPAPKSGRGTTAAQPAAPQPVAGFGQGLSGVYVGLERGLGAGAGIDGVGPPQAQLSIADTEEVDVLFPDGTYRRRLPVRGLATDLAWERAQQPILWGRWSRQGSQVVTDRGGYREVYTVQGDDLVSDRGRLWRKLPVVESARLDGSYARHDFRDAAAPRLVLHADGRYEDRGGFLRMVGSPWHLVVPDGDALLPSWSQAQADAALGPGSGTYSFGAFTLTLADRDGRVWRINAYLPPGESPPSPRRLVVNGRALVRD